MFSLAIKQLKTALILLLLLTLLTGFIYPMLVTAIAQILFPWRANGSLIEQNGKVVGSLLLGQTFTESKYFWGRPSATTPYPYNAASSSGSNFEPLNTDFIVQLKQRVALLQRVDSKNKQAIPVDLVTASGSGLDPDISPAAAFYQADRIAKVRHLPEELINNLIQKSIVPKTLGSLGEPRVNVLDLNLILDQLTANKEKN
jgi:K+-transporting ATPase ATPase C chain